MNRPDIATCPIENALTSIVADLHRSSVRDLVHFSEKHHRGSVYTGFADFIADGDEAELAIFSSGESFERFRDVGTMTEGGS